MEMPRPIASFMRRSKFPGEGGAGIVRGGL